MVLLALGCGRLPGIQDIAGKHPFVVFGTMDADRLAGLSSGNTGNANHVIPVYLYETG